MQNARVQRVETEVLVRRLDDGWESHVGWRSTVPLASVGKVLVLAEVARQLETGDLLGEQTTAVHPEDRHIGGTGLVTHLHRDEWSVAELAVLTASVSDNVATNTLIRLVGLESINRLAQEIGLEQTRVHDLIRDERTSEHPETFATGTSLELADLLTLVARRELHSERTSQRIHDWMRLCSDRSLVADSILHDPYGSTGTRVANKTGTDVGVRADVGIVTGRHTVVYAAVSTCPPGAERSAVQQLRRWGSTIERLAD